jgi:hypothetical protein
MKHIMGESMKQIKSYEFEPGDTLYYVDKQGDVYSLEITEDLLESQSEIPTSFFDNYVFKPYSPVTVYDDYGRLWLWSAKGTWTGAGMGSSFNVEYSDKVADVFITEEEALEFSKVRKRSNEENKFFNSYSKIEIKHAVSNRVLNTLTFTKYSLIELLKLVNIYRTENTPIKVSVIDYDGNEIAYSEVEKELERFY